MHVIQRDEGNGVILSTMKTDDNAALQRCTWLSGKWRCSNEEKLINKTRVLIF
jgi:hypothetical protein